MAGWKNPDQGMIQIKNLETKFGKIEEFKADFNDKEKEEKAFENLLSIFTDNQRALKGVTDAATAATERGQKPFSYVIGKYRDEKMDENWTAGTLKEFDGMFGYIVEILGDLPINTIGYPEVERLKETLLKLPPNRKTSPLYRNLSIQQILASKPQKVLSRKTVNKYLSLMSNFFDFAERYGYAEKNYFGGVSVKIKKRPNEDRQPFTDEDIAKLFSPDFFKAKPLHSYMFWAPLIGLYTGMRLEEICQLHLEDIRQVDEIWVFDIKAEGDRTVKTASGERMVPLHSVLIKMGLLDHIAQLNKKGKAMLFPELRPDKFGKYSARVSKWFNARYRRQCGITVLHVINSSLPKRQNDC